jgi:hypothetical protein
VYPTGYTPLHSQPLGRPSPEVVHFSTGAGGPLFDRLTNQWGFVVALDIRRPESSGSLPRQDGAAGGAAGLKGCWRERTCQAAIRTLRATAEFADRHRVGGRHP